MSSVLFWIKFLEMILNTFEQRPYLILQSGDYKFAFGNYLVCKIIKTVE